MKAVRAGGRGYDELVHAAHNAQLDGVARDRVVVGERQFLYVVVFARHPVLLSPDLRS
jgi:hypothetical protein